VNAGVNRRSFLRRSAALPPALAVADAAPVSAQPDGSAAPRAAPDGYAPLAQLRVPGTKEGVVSADGRTVFLAVTDGFAVVDCSDPADPVVVHENREPWAGAGNGGLEQVYDVKLDHENDLLAVVGPANPQDAFKGLIVYDVSDPTAPERVAVHGTEFFNHNCFAADGRVYLCGNTGGRNGVVIVDARSGEELGRWSIAEVDERWADVGSTLHDLTVHDGVAYLAHWDAGTWAVDVSDPTAPELRAKVRGRDPEAFLEMTRAERRQEFSEPPGNDHFVAVDGTGDLLGVGGESWDVTPDGEGGGPSPITLYDVSDLDDPRELAVIDPPPTQDPTLGGVWTTSHNFEFRGDRLYTSWYEGGVRVYDVRDPAEPELLARWRDSDDTSFWTARVAVEGEFFIATSHRDGPRAAEGSSFDRAALYTFPDPPSDAAPLSATPSPGTPTGTATDTPTTTPSPTRSPTATTGESTATDGQSGFGPLAALGGVGLGAWRLLRERGTED
jgi:hypothetical protein